MATELAGIAVTADAQTENAEKALDRLGIKFDSTVQRFRTANGTFLSAAQVQKALAGQFDATADAAEGLASKLQSGAGEARNFGLALTAGITIPITAAVAGIVGLGATTETALNRMQGTSHATVAQMDQVRAKARELGKDLDLPNTSARNAALGMLELNKGGLTVEQSMDAARGTIQLAKAALIDEGRAAVITADALNTFGLAGDQAVRVADLLAGAASASSGEVTDMASALAQAGAVAKGANVPIEDAMTAISLLAKNGIKGSDAGTSLKTFLLALQTPVSDSAANALQKLKLEAYDANNQLKPLPQIIGEFRSKLDTLDDKSKASFLKEVFGADAIRAARILFGEGTAGFEKMRQAVSRSGQAQEQAAAATRGLEGAWGGLLSVIETIGTDIYEDLKEPLTQAVQLITSGVQLIGDAWVALGPTAKVAIASMLTIAAAAGPIITVVATIAGAVLGLAGTLAGLSAAGVTIGAVGAFLLPVAAVIAGLIAVVVEMGAIMTATAVTIYAAWTSNIGGVRDFALQVWNDLSAGVSSVVAFIKHLWAEFGGDISSVFQSAMGVIWTVADSVLGFIVGEFSDAWDAIAGFTREVWPSVKDFVVAAVQGIVLGVRVALAVIQGLWQSHGQYIVGIVSAAFGVVKTVIKTVMNTVLDTVALVVQLLDGRFSEAGETLKRMGARIVSAWADVLTGIGKILFNLGALIFASMAKLAIQVYEKGKEVGKKIILGILAGIAVMSPGGLIAAALVAAIRQGGDAGVAEAETTAARISNALGAGLSIGMNRIASALDNFGQTPAEEGSGSGLKNMNFGGGGGGGKKGGGGGSGESAASKRAKEELKAIEIVEAAVERSYNRRREDEEHYYSIGRKSIDSYYGMLETLEDEHYASQLRIAQAELKVAEATKGSQREKQNAIAEAQDKIKSLFEEHQQSLTKIDREAAAARREASDTAWSNETRRMEEVARGQEAIYQRMADAGVMTFRAAQEAISGSQHELLLRQKKEIEKQIKDVDPESPQAARLQGELDVLLQIIENFLKEREYLFKNASARDLSTEQDHASKLRSIYEGIANGQRDSQREHLRLLEAAGVSKEYIWRREMQLDLAAEAAAHESRARDLQDQREYIEKTYENTEYKRKLLAAVNAQIEAEEQRSTAKRAAITEEFYNKERAKLRDLADKIVGAFDKALGALKEDGWKGFFRSIGESFRDLLKQMALDLLKSQMLKILQSIRGIPAPGQTQGQTQNQSAPAGTGAGSFFGIDLSGILSNLFNLGSNERDQNHSGPGAVREAGVEMSNSIKAAGQNSSTAVERTGEEQARSLSGIGKNITAGLLQIANIIAVSGAQRGSFWKGLLIAAASGFLSGLANGLSNPSGGGGEGGGGSTGPGTGGGGLGTGIHAFATGGLIRGAGTSTSDSIDARLSNFEYVIKAPSVRSVSVAALDYINQYGKLPPTPQRAYATGGLVTTLPRASSPGVAAPAPQGRDVSAASPAYGQPPIVNVNIRPDRDGRVRSRSQVTVELAQAANSVRGDM